LGEVNASLILEQVLTKILNIMKHLVQLMVKSPKRFSTLSLSKYKDEKGKWRVYTDINGEEQEIWKLTRASLFLDISEKQDKKLYEFLKDHPLSTKSYTITDLRQKEEVEVENLLTSADAILIASKMGIAETNDFARLLGITLDADQDVIKARLIKIANTKPEKFLDLYHHPEKDEMVFIKKALDKKIIVRSNGVYKHNRITLGLTEEAVMTWLKENADVYALMKQELRGNVKVDVKPKSKKVKA
jgi:hypothetical protein